MPLLIQTPTNASDALQLAANRGLLPTRLDSAGLARLAREVRERAVFSARVDNVRYLQAIRQVVNGILEGDLDRPLARLILRQTLTALGYAPEGADGTPGGFPDGAPVPDAIQGTLQDLSSDRRIRLVLETQERLLLNAGLRERGLNRVSVFPAWELIRLYDREEPRDWAQRWSERAGPVLFNQAGDPAFPGRLIAFKTARIWEELGKEFADGIDAPHPPYAFNSGMGWREVPREELIAAGVALPNQRIDNEAGVELPEPAANLDADQDLLEELAREFNIERSAP